MTATREALIPRATYRLQLHAGFDFDAARAVLPYLQRLGISHVYCSPIATARAGSLHGYDVVDPTAISPELGGREGFERFALAARELGLGLLLDIVPNHMGVSGTDNPWWADLLENGRASAFAGHFDIDWTPDNPALHGKVLAPVLGAAYGATLAAGEIQVTLDAARGRLALAIGPQRFPLDPGTYAVVLRHLPEAPTAVPPAPPIPPALERLAQAFEALPARDEADPARRALRASRQRELQSDLADALAQDADLRAALTRAVDAINAPAGRAALHALHDAQAFRLAYWRSAADGINYRRFFDVNELAALRIEDPAVFEATHALPLELAAAGWVDGLRIDHPDGLLDPRTYFDRLQQGFVQRRAAGAVAAPAGERPLYVVAEKIAAGHEELPAEWAVHGTTGYRFANVSGGLFVERRNADRMERAWRAFTGTQAGYADILREAKRKAAREALGAQLTGLAHRLRLVALADLDSRDHGFNSLRDALADVATEMTVYRTYVTLDGAVSAQDRHYIDQAVAQARQLGDPADAALYEFVRRCLLGESDVPDPAHLARVRDFAVRFQQYSAPAAAKGVEDTAFYRYHRLVSLNEVGGEPADFGTSAQAFHAENLQVAAHWPHTMLATSTHDNKRAEDVRNRISVLSEQPGEWRLSLQRWRVATRGWRTLVGSAPAPSQADQVLLHQTLLGTLPPEGLTEATLPPYRDRIEATLLKSAREAKVHTSWASNRADYETALVGFVRHVLGQVQGNPVLAGLQARATDLAWYGALNSASQTLLKLASPGVPDTYQGTELADLSMVDPDNRRPVDYATRDRALAAFEALGNVQARRAELGRVAETLTDGRLKLWLLWRLLGLRRAEPDLFERGGYVPLRVTGLRHRHVVAFAREYQGGDGAGGGGGGADDGMTLIVVAARKFVGLAPRCGSMPVGRECWGNTAVHRPRARQGATPAHDVLTGEALSLPAGPLWLGEHFSQLPFAAILVRPAPARG